MAYRSVHSENWICLVGKIARDGSIRLFLDEEEVIDVIDFIVIDHHEDVTSSSKSQNQQLANKGRHALIAQVGELNQSVVIRDRQPS